MGRIHTRNFAAQPDVAMVGICDVYDPRAEVGAQIAECLGQKLYDEVIQRLFWYRDRFGDCDVKYRCKEDPKMTGWLFTQRRRRREGQWKRERVERLDGIGMRW